MSNNLKVLRDGIIFDNPVLIQVVGMCATLATSTSIINGAGMGLSTTAVLIGSNIVISLLRKFIPDTVRIPCFIVVIASFVTVVQLLLQAFLPAINDALGLFIPLIVVNCIVLGRAEAFASKNGPLTSLCDGIGNGLGFTLALCFIGLIREFLGAGTLFGVTVLPEAFPKTLVMIMAPGAFFTYGKLMAIFKRLIGKMKANKAAKEEAAA